MNFDRQKLGDFFISVGINLIFGLIFLRDKIWGEPSTQLKLNTLVLFLIGLITVPISIPSIIIGFLVIRKL